MDNTGQQSSYSLPPDSPTDTTPRVGHNRRRVLLPGRLDTRPAPACTSRPLRRDSGRILSLGVATQEGGRRRGAAAGQAEAVPAARLSRAVFWWQPCRPLPG